MTTVEVFAPAKVNLTLHITGRRDDGYHLLDSLVAFASIGHHLPGFLRCYGDRDLFQRFRLRFVLAPPLLFVLSAAFVFNGLHGLEFIVLFWATWHGLMQMYGFMRIYDVKAGASSPWTARRSAASVASGPGSPHFGSPGRYL